jgi:predicted lactoylglutathione lyase
MPKQEPSFVSPVGSIENRLQQLHETVSLSAEQEAKIKAVLMKNDAAMKTAVAAFRASHTKEDRQKLSALIKAQNVEINALLSDAQKTKGLSAQNAISSARGFRPATGSSSATLAAPPPSAQTTPTTKQSTP